MEGWGYDAAGNLTSDGITTSTYDALNRLTATSGGSPSRSYTYNGDGVLLQQIAAGTTTRFTQDLASPLSQVLQTTVGSATTDYLYGLDRLASVQSGTRTWYDTDVLGSVRQTLTNTGTPISTFAYDPWGTVEGSTVPPMFGFTGELQDASTGIVNLRARWYQPQQGRFVSRDPFEGFAEQPYSLNPYQYAYSQPTRFTDPSGQCIPYVEPGCRPIWEIGAGPNTADLGHIIGVAAHPFVQAIQPTSNLLFNPGQAWPIVVRGARVFYGNQADVLADLVGGTFEGIGNIGVDVGMGLWCHDIDRLTTGLSNGALLLSGAALGNALAGRMAIQNELPIGDTEVFNATRSLPAESAAQGAKLRGALAIEEALSNFTRSGELIPELIRRSRRIVEGDDLGNVALRRELTSDGSKLEDWGKYETPRLNSPLGDFKVHFYRNRVTDAVNYTFDYKAVLQVSHQPQIPIPEFINLLQK